MTKRPSIRLLGLGPTDKVRVYDYKPTTGAGKSRRLAAEPAAFNVTFGNVTIHGAKPSAAAVKANVARSTKALERVTQDVVKAGVFIPRKKGVPRYAIAEGEPDVFIRRLNGRTERGRLVKGAFKVI